MRKRHFLWLGVGLTLLVFLSVANAQEKYPSRTIEVVNPWRAGGATHVLATVWADELGKVLNVPVIVVPKPGGGGVQGSAYVARAPKDGYTLLHAMAETNTLGPNMTKDVPYDPMKDFTPLCLYGAQPCVYAVRIDSPFKTLGDLIEYARQNPGKLKNGVSGLGTESHLNIEILNDKAKIKIVTVPFDGSNPLTVALLGGHIDLGGLPITPKAHLGAQILGGKLRGLAVTSSKRHPEFPDIPTTAELGFPEVNLMGWYGIAAPAGVPQPTLDVLNRTLEKMFKDPRVVELIKNAGLAVDYRGPEEFRRFLEAEFVSTEKLLKALDLYKK